MPNSSDPNDEDDVNPLLRDYRGAIMLNNMGVTLLSRRAYPQALETLVDALFAMKSLVCRGTGREIAGATNDHSSASSTSSMESKVKRSRGYLAQHQQQVAASGTEITLKVMSYRDLGTPVEWIFCTHIRRPFSWTAFQIESVSGSSFDPAERDFYFEATLVLHNLAMSHAFKSLVLASGVRSNGLLFSNNVTKTEMVLENGAALDMLIYANSILSTRYPLAKDAEQKARLLCMTVAIVKTIVQVLVSDVASGGQQRPPPMDRIIVYCATTRLHAHINELRFLLLLLANHRRVKTAPAA